jgi:hypothetical protein
MLWIPIVHVISQDDTLDGGNIPDRQITAQIEVLNSDYGPSGINFMLVNVTRTANAAWFNSVASNT